MTKPAWVRTSDLFGAKLFGATAEPRYHGGGRYWVRTSDLFGATAEPRYHGGGRYWVRTSDLFGATAEPRYHGGGRYWVRTSDLFGVNEARYHCANRPGDCGAR